MTIFVENKGKFLKNDAELSEKDAVDLLEKLQKYLKKIGGKTAAAFQPALLEVATEGGFYVDAGTKNNGQYGSQDTVIVGTDANGTVIFEKKIGDVTNNNGEIQAIVTMLQYIKDNKLEDAIIYSDSQIAVNWTKKGKTKDSPSNEPFVILAHRLVEETETKLIWIPREKNKAGHFIEDKYCL